MRRGRLVTEERVEIDGIRTFIRRRSGSGVPTVFVHGVPTHSAEWLPFLKRIEGPGLAIDLPNFGHSERLGPDRFDASMHAYADFVGAAIDALCPDGFNLVVHDWGGIALQPAQRRAERVRRLVVIDAAPLLPGYRWHWVARLWRRRGVGELLNATATRATFAAMLRLARPGRRAMPPEFVEMVWSCWDRKMWRALLRLYRSGDPAALEAAGAHLDRLRCPALVVWGEADPYVPEEFGEAYAARLPEGELVAVDDAGHWPWIDRPELVSRVAEFLRPAAS